MKHLKLSLIVLAILFSSISLFAQTDSVKCNSQIQFHLINGYSLSYLNMLSPSTGLRFKADLGLSGSFEDSENNESYYGNSLNTVHKYKLDNNSNSQYLNLVVNYCWLSNITKEVRLYLGIGPLISFSRESNERNSETITTSPNGASKSMNESTKSFIGLGIQGVLGIECAVTEKISLLAEFNLNGTYSWNHWNNKGEYQSEELTGIESTSDSNSWNYGLNNLKIGIAYNF